MKFKIIIFFILLISCASNQNMMQYKKPYNSKGFAFIFSEADFKNGLINGRLDNSIMQISHRSLKTNSLIKIINPITNKTLTLKNHKRLKYPEMYKVLITKPVADKLDLDSNLPLVEIMEQKKNKSFVAKKAKIFNEEKKISKNAPVTSVQISNISKNKMKKKSSIDQIFILIASFYSKETAEFLKKRITKELPNYDIKKLKIRKKKDKEINLISGPYKTINLMKNDYIQLKKFGFEDLDITLNE